MEPAKLHSHPDIFAVYSIFQGQLYSLREEKQDIYEKNRLGQLQASLMK